LTGNEKALYKRDKGEKRIMSITTQAMASSIPSGKSVSLTTLLLSLALAVSTTAAGLFAVQAFRPAPPANPSVETSSCMAIRGNEPYVQTDMVMPQLAKIRYTGTVYYPWPYASPPHLKLTSSNSRRLYDIIKEDEFGFTWYARLTLDDIDEDVRKTAERNNPLVKAITVEGLERTGYLVIKPTVEFDNFTWEAKGMPATKETLAMRVFPQEGTFTFADQEGTVSFPIPYATGPNVELSGTLGRSIVVVESRPTGFKWKHTGAGNPDNLSIHWTAKGVRAAELPKANSP
jgi:hypothetical protein